MATLPQLDTAPHHHAHGPHASHGGEGHIQSHHSHYHHFQQQHPAPLIHAHSRPLPLHTQAPPSALITTGHSQHHHHGAPPKPETWSHRHFPTYHATSSKLLSKKWEERARQIHLQKLRNAACTVDNRPPKRRPHLEVRLKKLQSEQERLYEIERANHILLDRISFQMQAASNLQPGISPAADEPTPVPGGTTVLTASGTPAPGSLHGPRRAQILRSIAKENATIMQRIEDQPPNYKRSNWTRERCKNLDYLRNIASFPESYTRLLEDHLEIGRKKKNGEAGACGPGCSHGHSGHGTAQEGPRKLAPPPVQRPKTAQNPRTGGLNSPTVATLGNPRMSASLIGPRGIVGRPQRAGSARDLGSKRASLLELARGDDDLDLAPSEEGTAGEEDWVPVLETGRPQTRVNRMKGPLSEYGESEDERERDRGRQTETASFGFETENESEGAGPSRPESREQLDDEQRYDGGAAAEAEEEDNEPAPTQRHATPSEAADEQLAGAFAEQGNQYSDEYDNEKFESLPSLPAQDSRPVSAIVDY
ncbi:KIAA1430-like protein-domain-containing protein [Fimicolochytrium jonesii]|uniref:KIAA1430-like protein-domain-containing protein n=1 Tax=Fimicolochytrium jonesii TaxID=1396493 RepID=UPI0022FEB40F|nr:KIAA1430-like protein-domain-containing protein [Fimicolochytrium jonesii]KAI8821833.1 KIAA1430-like protein-domain-containing protein [Fimicolochytrium jonesii]